MSSKSGKPAPAQNTMSTTAEAVAARLRESLLQDKQELEVDKIFKDLVKLEGSDLHMKVGQPPMVRVA
ncbi:MAG: twitching motility protein PilT, partial [Planctomycetota bacterium]|nr:twitching motility protein PilT [Planctomycetota bacterium]